MISPIYSFSHFYTKIFGSVYKPLYCIWTRKDDFLFFSDENSGNHSEHSYLRSFSSLLPAHCIIDNTYLEFRSYLVQLYIRSWSQPQSWTVTKIQRFKIDIDTFYDHVVSSLTCSNAPKTALENINYEVDARNAIWALKWYRIINFLSGKLVDTYAGHLQAFINIHRNQLDRAHSSRQSSIQPNNMHSFDWRSLFHSSLSHCYLGKNYQRWS